MTQLASQTTVLKLRYARVRRVMNAAGTEVFMLHEKSSFVAQKLPRGTQMPAWRAIPMHVVTALGFHYLLSLIVVWCGQIGSTCCWHLVTPLDLVVECFQH